MRKRKERYWRCDHCYTLLKRKKKDSNRWRYCHCGTEMVKAIKYPDESWWKRRRKYYHKISQSRWDEIKFKSKIRDSHGYILRISKRARQLWKQFENIQQKRTFLRYGELFLKEIHDNCIHRLGVNGNCNPPEIFIYPKEPVFTRGQYENSLMSGKYRITVWMMELTQMKSTFLHEVLHHVDAQANCKDGSVIKYHGHGRDWHSRLTMFADRLNVSHVIKEILE